MKLGPLTKPDKRNKSTSKNCLKIVRSLIFFPFMINLEQSGKLTAEPQSTKLTFSLKVTFYFTKIENRTKTFFTQLSHYCFE